MPPAVPVTQGSSTSCLQAKEGTLGLSVKGRGLEQVWRENEKRTRDHLAHLIIDWAKILFLAQ